MEQYYKFTGNDYKFIPLFSCFENLCSCSMGLCFPYCLFGKIYEKAQFGKCWVGCIKLLSLQILINCFFSTIIYSLEWNMFLQKEFEYSKQLYLCNKNQTCQINYNDYETELINNKCITNNTEICDCSNKILIDKCNYSLNTLPNNIENFINYIVIISFINILILSTFTGLFLGHYRTKISHKYNILYNSRYNFLIHFIPCTNQCALCQEYNTIEMIEAIRPIEPIQKFKYDI